MKVIELPDGTFDVQNDSGQSVLGPFGGPFRQRESAEATARLLNAFEAVDSRIDAINESLRSAKPCLTSTRLERDRKLLECVKALQQVRGDLGFMSLDEHVRTAVESALVPVGGWEAGLARIEEMLSDE